MRFVTLLPLLALGCIEESSIQPPDTVATPTQEGSARISPDGGTYLLFDGVSLVVPAGAVEAETEVRAFEALTGPEGATIGVRFEPELALATPAALRFAVPDAGPQFRAFLDNGHGGFYQPDQVRPPEGIEATVPVLAQTVIAPNQPVEEIQIIAPPAEVDVLFVIDNSCSMADQQALLAAEAPSLLNYFLGTDIDYHIGLTTTDMDSPNQSGRLREIAGARWIDPLTPDPNLTFGEMALMGTNGSFEERGLDTAFAALDTLRNTDNAGFWRDEAALHVVYVSDEDDQSTMTPVDFADWMLASKPFDGEAQVHGILGLPSNPCVEVDTPGFRYLDVVSTTGGAGYDLCASNWSLFMDGIGFDATGWERVYPVLHEADPASVSVEADLPDGTTVSYDPAVWTYDPAAGTVTFDGDEVPPPGSVVRISYVPI